jgi:hypothetical protein
MQMDRTEKPSRRWAFTLVALAAFIAGMALGQLGAVRDVGRSRIAWPDTPQPQSRSLQP